MSRKRPYRPYDITHNIGADVHRPRVSEVRQWMINDVPLFLNGERVVLKDVFERGNVLAIESHTSFMAHLMFCTSYAAVKNTNPLRIVDTSLLKVGAP